MLQTHPLKTKTITSAILFGIGDGICQLLVEKKKEFDYRRCFNFFVGGGVCGPILHYWYGFLGNLVAKPCLAAKPKLVKTLLQVSIDQTMCSPLFLSFFYAVINTLDGKSL